MCFISFQVFHLAGKCWGRSTTGGERIERQESSGGEQNGAFQNRSTREYGEFILARLPPLVAMVLFWLAVLLRHRHAILAHAGALDLHVCLGPGLFEFAL